MRAGGRMLWAVLRRRGWILVLTTIAVTAAVAAVASVRSTSSTAEATLLVPPSFGSQTPGQADQATALAETYARLVPADAAIARAVARRVDAPVGEVRAAISARQRAGTALLRVAFASASAERAERGARALADVLSSAIPEGSSIAGGSLLLVSPPADAELRDGEYVAIAEVVVNSGAGPMTPANADGATRLARTYAGILADDTAVVRAVGERLGVSAAAVRSRVSIINDESTSLLRVDYRAPTEREAVAGARAFARAVSGADPVSPNLAPGSLSIVRLPEATGGAAGSQIRGAIPIGVVLGLALGLVLVVARERADRRIDDPADLAEELGCPATSLRALSDAAAATLLRRWRALDGDRSTTRVALVGVGRPASAVADAVADRLALAGRETEIPTAVLHGWGPGGDAAGPEVVVVVPNGSGPEGAALASDLVVLLVREGDRASAVRAASSGMRGLGREPTWALLAPRRARR